MEVDGAVPRGVENRSREDASVGDHDERVRARGHEGLEKLRRAHLLRLDHAQAAGESGRPDGRGQRRLRASGGAIGLGDDQRDLVPCGKDRVERPGVRLCLGACSHLQWGYLRF